MITVKRIVLAFLLAVVTTLVAADEMNLPMHSTGEGNAQQCLLAAADTRVPLPTISKGKGPKCVEPTDVMRRDHMKFLLHQRDATVRQGVRTKKYSLTGCIACHVQRDARGQAIPINAPGQFCEDCHRYTAVRMDCFECHATTPDSGTEAVSMNPRGGIMDTTTASLPAWQQLFLYVGAQRAIQ